MSQLYIGFGPLERKVIYVGQENSNRNGAVGGVGTGLAKVFWKKVITQ